MNRLLVNDQTKNEYVLTSLLQELRTCKTFMFSVAFITEGGIAMLKSDLLDLQAKGVTGRIITSNYLNFNSPKMFRELLKLKNVEVRLTNLIGFHSKGYIFQHDKYYSLIVGSSNLTQTAMKVNYEWNVKFNTYEKVRSKIEAIHQFENTWELSEQLSEIWIRKYEKLYSEIPSSDYFDLNNNLKNNLNIDFPKDNFEIVPNKMQQSALQKIKNVRENKSNRALIISATGTGKTYLSAFDIRDFSPKRMLFLVHREQILQKAKNDFQKIIKTNPSDFGVLSGNQKDMDAPYLFATVQTMIKDEILNSFDKNYFDYILIDEAHKSGAKTYQKLVDYFTPKFLLGMTATPDRMDSFNLYELFDYNVAYEIRLHEAIEEEMLCPFHYFGVTDFILNGELVDETSEFSLLASQERVNHIVEKITYYGYSGSRVQGLIFCSRKDEAKELSLLLNNRGYQTCALTGDDSQEVRNKAVDNLEQGNLDYILTVDIFNEGIDIPSVNQVVMLRQTESSIIFIQQLGRGLRKHASKDYVTIIDFIGNYKNNYLKAVALSGDYSQNKDNIRRHIKDTTFLKGVSTINFEAIAKEQIFKSISETNLTASKILKAAYESLKYRLGRKPRLVDFWINQSIDLVVLLEKYDNYHDFLIKIKEDVPSLNKNEDEYKLLTFMSVEFLNGKRLHEVLLIEMLLEKETVTLKEYEQILKEYNCLWNEHMLRSMVKILNKSFFYEQPLKKYGAEPLVTFEEDEFCRNKLLDNMEDVTKAYITDIIQTAKARSVKYKQDSQFTLYEKYLRKDMGRLLNWDKPEILYGYFIKQNSCPIFVTLHNSQQHDNFENEFLDNQRLTWFTKTRRTLNSSDVQEILNANKNGIIFHLFVKKNNDEGKDFYYLGQVSIIPDSPKEISMKDGKGNMLPAVAIEFLLEHPVEQNLYQYLLN